MSSFNTAIPLSLYIHLPWCIKKCPYCDFNSHKAPDSVPEQDYIHCLIDELDQQLPQIWGRPLVSIFFGGGTPSLFSPSAIGEILQQVRNRFNFSNHIEITLEANPGTVEQQRFAGFLEAGINRLSLGIQSFAADKLRLLGRIHDDDEAHQAVDAAKAAGFDNINLDVMFGLPQQSVEQALADLKAAILHQPTHISWYQLTLEPNTLFHRYPPALPDDDLLWDMQRLGGQYLMDHHFTQYEVSAFSLAQRQCVHNQNYWQFGDYVGIGAGAHSKITDSATATVNRHWNVKNPRDYLNPNKAFCANRQSLCEADLIFEFMLNGLRLTDSLSLDLFEQRTGLSAESLQQPLAEAHQRHWLNVDNNQIHLSELGRRFLNDVVALFLPQKTS